MYPFQKTVSFLYQLDKNNNSLWFHEHRPEYLEIKKEFESFVSELLSEVIIFDESLRFLSIKDCTFRINRDVRFSKNKQPYKTHLGASFINSGKNGSNPGYYFQIEPSGKIMVGGGWYLLDSKQLSLVRQAISKNAEVFNSILGELEFVKLYSGLDNTNNLKTHPKGYSSEDKNIVLLRQTNFIVFNYIELSKLDYTELKQIIIHHFNTLYPLINLLRKVV